MDSSTLYDTWHTDHGGDFAAGVRLLVLHNPRYLTQKAMQRLQQIAASPGEYVSDYDLGKLEGALRESLTPGPSPVERGGAAPKTIVGGILPPLSFGEGPGVRPTDTTRALHKLHSHHHALMVSSGTDEERALHARKIMSEILPALDTEYDKQRHPTPVPSPEGRGKTLSEFSVTPPFGGGDGGGVEMIKRLASLRTRIARLKNHLIPDAKDLKRRAHLEKELAEKTAEKENLERLLSE